MNSETISELHNGFETAMIDYKAASNLVYKPQFISNNYKEGRKVLSSIEDELLACDSFAISVAFITMGGITPLLQTLQELEKKKIRGKILTTDYLNFSQPEALKKLAGLHNIELRMYRADEAETGFHTKGYIFHNDETYRIIIGSSNMTQSALTRNMEWNTRIVSTQNGEMARNIVEEFSDLWKSEYTQDFDTFIDDYQTQYEIIRKQRETARKEEITSIEQYTLKPNSMQVGFIQNLRKIIARGEKKALLISATGTGKTYASAFAMRELGFRRVLFLVHRGQLARQTKRSYERVFGKSVSMGLVGAGFSEYDKDYIFATVQTLNRDSHLLQYERNAFDCIILDEAHHVSAETYQKIMNFFTPKLWLGMTATPDKRDDDIEGRNIYQIFDYQIAYEIRLQQAMEEMLLCPFHYFGITDISVLDDKTVKAGKISVRDFNQLVGDRRVQHIIEQTRYYGYSGDRVKGLIFCSRIDESRALSEKFNALGYRTVALDGNTPEGDRTRAFERLAMDERDATPEAEPLDYIFSVEILNEGVDIVEVNQVIMLRPTESPIVFIQQLGRGLRKAEGKEYVVILDFIGNYTNNFMIPIALSGDRSYNPDTIRKYVISGNNTIPGASTIHFDEIAKEKIFSSIDKIRGMKSIIRESYISLKNRLGRVPYLLDFYENSEIDPLVIIREYKSYSAFLLSEEKERFEGKMSAQELLTMEYLAKTVLSGTRPHELVLLKELMTNECVGMKELSERIAAQYGYIVNLEDVEAAVSVLEGKFVSKDEEYQKYCHIEILDTDGRGMVSRLKSYSDRLGHEEFYRQMNDLIEVGLRRYQEKYSSQNQFTLYEKYSRRDISLLMNCERDLSSIMYGMKRIGDDVFIFVTYHKAESQDEKKEYADGKPDYADEFEDNLLFRWDSQMGRGIDSSYVQDVLNAGHKHLLVKKSDAETSFYYMGEFDVVDTRPAKKKDNTGKERDIAKFTMRMHHAVRDDLLRYLRSGLENEAADRAVV